MNLCNALEISITRWSNEYNVRGIEIHAGEPDQCGHRYTVSVWQDKYGGSFLIQTNFSEFFESRLRIEDAYSTALKLATFIDPTVPVETYAPEAE